MHETIHTLLQELDTYQGREAGLRSIYRWHNWAPMFYRPHLYSHGKKVAGMVAAVAPVVRDTLGPSFDIKRALALALVHDDPELITGDYQAGDKSKMSQEQLAAIDAEERAAITELSTKFPATVGGFSYQDLQEDIQDLRTPEARVAKYLDVLDSFGEGIHEIYGGNLTFTKHLVNEFGVIPLFDVYNYERRIKMTHKYPELEALSGKHTLFELAPPLEWTSMVGDFSPHTKESLVVPTGFAQYDLWKQLIIDSNDQEELESLYTQREFLT